MLQSRAEHPLAIPAYAKTPEYMAAYNGASLMITAYMFLFLETITIIAYFASRHIKRLVNQPEIPWLMVGAYITGGGLCIMSLLGLYIGGAGHHTLTIPMWKLLWYSKINKASEWTYIPSVTFPKLAILLLYMRLFTTHSRGLRYCCYAIATVMILLLLVGLVYPGVSCIPFAYNWDKTIPGGKCMDTRTAYCWASFPNIVTDLALMALCFPAIYRVQVPPIKKIGLFATFALGSVGLITSIIRFAIFFKTDFTNDSWMATRVMIWTVVEPGVYFIAAALLNMRPLLRYIFKDLGVSSYFFKFSSFMPSFRKNSQRRLNHSSYKEMSIRKRKHIELECTKLSTPEQAKTRDKYNQLNRGRGRGRGRDLERGEIEINVSPGES